MPEKRKPWLGGYVRVGKKGPTYVIEKWIKGDHFHVSTRCRTERAALKQLERFEANPRGYSPLDANEDALELTSELLEEYATWMASARRNSREWIYNSTRYLRHWIVDLDGRDLRRLSLRDLRDALARRKSSRKHRIEAIKAFCGWLRKEKGLLSHAQDRTLDLAVPQSAPAKHKRRRVVPEAHVHAVLAVLPDETADVMRLQLATAWHVSEVRRFASRGEIVRPDGGAPLAVLVTKHKSGDLTRTPIQRPEQVATAERILARGRIPIPETISRQLAAACEKIRKREADAGVPEKDRMPHFRLGDMRHTVLTYAVQMGATPQQASEFANHRSVATTRKYYLDLAVPTVSVPTLRLVKGTG